MTGSQRILIDLDRPQHWPADLVDVLETHHGALRSREVGPLSDRFGAAIYAIVDALAPYSVVG